MKNFNEYIKESNAIDKQYPLTCKVISEKILSRNNTHIKKDDIFYIKNIDFESNEAKISKIDDNIGGYTNYTVYLNEIEIIPDIYVFGRYNL